MKTIRYGSTALFLLACLPLFGQWLPTNFPSEYRVTELNVSGRRIIANLGGAVFVSTDGGQTTEWITEGDGLPFAPYALVTDSALFVTASDYNIYRTTDWGENWQAATFDPAPASLTHFSDLFTNRAGDKFAVNDRGQLYRSADGLHWKEVIIEGPDLNTDQFLLSGIALGNDTLLLGLAGGVFRSGDDGLTWTYREFSERGLQVHRLDTTLQGALYAATTGSGVYRSLDGGVDWEPLNNGLPDQRRNILDMEIVDGNDVYITNNIDRDDPGNLYRYNTTEERWEKLCANEEAEFVFDQLVSDETHLYASISDNKGIWKRPLVELTGSECSITSTTSIASVQALRFYPNPVREQVIIDRDFSGMKIAYSILNAFGREVKNGHRQPTDERMQIDLRQLPAGPYFLSLLTGEGDRYTARLLKQ
ncbi:T9SS type A sorting domain-containing protein [Lewinella sp. IMCC34191]|uniref:T9SS type A sorting domain-containing protein n=1 Tax=Lewinella sp. IMCC34191 TaxID=2259172 RepID=UPI000E249DC1|nr:T9SS type A sorting domain-containing protein [Lewinella sp. IMCC34191]